MQYFNIFFYFFYLILWFIWESNRIFAIQSCTPQHNKKMRTFQIKNMYWLCFVLSLSGALYAALQRTDTVQKTQFLPYNGKTIVMQKKEHEGMHDEREELRERLEWFEKMHRAAPGVDWRSIDTETRRVRQEMLLKALKNGRLSGDEFAGGKVEGDWREKGSQNCSGRVLLAELDVKNNVLYCASDGGNFWKGTPKGKNWKVLNDKQRFYGICLLKRVEEGGKPVFIMAENRNVYRSTDDCATWQPAKGIDGMKDGGSIQKAVIHSNGKNIAVVAFEWNAVSGSGRTALYYSTDAGINFKKVSTSFNNPYAYGQNHDLWTDYYSNTPIYYINDGKVMTLDETTGTPADLSTITGAPKGTNMLTGAKKGDKTTIYAYANATIYRSEDAGLTWELRSKTGRYPFFKTSFSCSYEDPNFLFFGDIECWKSKDAAKTWNKQNEWYDYYDNIKGTLHADIPGVFPFKRADGKEIHYVCTDGGIYYSENGLQTVENIALDGLNISQYYSVYTNQNDSNYVYLGAQDQGFQRCQNDSGNVLSFDQIFSGDYGHLSSSDGGKSLWAVYPGSAVYLGNAQTGPPTGSWDFKGTMSAWIPFLMPNPTNNKQAFLAGGSLTNGGKDSKIIKLTASGGSINATAMSFDFKKASEGDVSAIAYDPNNLNTWYAITSNGRFFVSKDKGSNWQESSSGFSGPSPHYLYGSDIYVSKLDSGTVYVCGSGYSNAPVFVSKDYGQTFTDISAGLPSTHVYAITANTDETLLFAATEVGPFMYVVEDDMWYDLVGSGAPDQVYWAVEFLHTSQTVRFATYGRGAWDFKIKRQPKRKVKDDGDTDPPTAINEQNRLQAQVSVFPNPATQGATLAIRLPAAALNGTPNLKKAYLKDASGRLLAELNVKPIYGTNEAQTTLPLNLPKGLFILEILIGNNRVGKRIQIE